MTRRTTQGPPSRQIMTVLGPIAPNQLGLALGHDHVLIDAFEIYGKSSADYSWIIDDVELAIDELKLFAKHGGAAIVDPTNIGLGRDPSALHAISLASGVHIVMGSGWYREAVYPRYVWEESANELADRIVTEVRQGVGDTSVRPGFIGEIGTGRLAISPAEERVLRAAARAQRKTGLTIVTHTTHFGELAIEQLDLLREEGIGADRVVVSHLGDRIGLGVVLRIAERGAWLGIDNLGLDGGYAPLQEKAKLVAALIHEGFGNRIILGNDTCTTTQLVAYGGQGYANMIQNFIPRLRTVGLAEGDIENLTVTNPAQAFAYTDRLTEA